MPSNTTFSYVYVLESLKDSKRYIGFTKDLRRGVQQHNTQKSIATKPRTPLKLIYFEGCLYELDAKRRENYLKTTQGRRFLGLRLIEYSKNKNGVLPES